MIDFILHRSIIFTTNSNNSNGK